MHTRPPTPALDHDACRLAYAARDPRFDGRFFVGVRTTGIYCRPVCPAPPPKPENVAFYPSAAAAMEAGLRPCLRCRPETAPGSPAWLGGRGTVARALALLESALDEGTGIDEIAARLEISRRQLDRLVWQHLGSPAAAVLRTRRLHRAKSLLDETTLPMAEVAWAAGFSSLRRFNEAVVAAWGITPSELRSRSRQRRGSGNPAVLVLALKYRPPFAWEALLEFLAGRAIPGVESVEDGVYRRTFEVTDPRSGETLDGVLSVRQVGHQLQLELPALVAPVLPRLVARVRRVFDLDADPSAIALRLQSDPLLAANVAREPGLRVPGAWDGFELAVRAVLGQQVSVKGATTLAGRLVQRAGRELADPPADGTLSHVFPRSAVLAAANLDGIGLTGTRIATLGALATSVAGGELVLSSTVDPARLRSSLVSLPGIGPWTAHYVTMRLGDPDAFPASDLVLLRALAAEPTGSTSVSARARELESRAEVWRPWRAYAALHLWRGDAARATGGSTADHTSLPKETSQDV